MKISYLKMTNFMLYKKFHKNFDDKDVVGIICEYKDNKNKSNRGGKTTIMEAIKYALHGNTRAKKEIKLIHRGQNHMEVEIGLVDNDGKVFKIRRCRDHKNSGLLECDWVDKKAEAQEAINELVGCDGKEFELINYFKQADINKFMLLPAGEKKEHLMKWLDNTHWNKLWKAVDVDLKEKYKSLGNKKIQKETILEGLGSVKKLKEKIHMVEIEIDSIDQALMSLRSEKGELEQKHKSKDDIKKLKKEKKQLWKEISELNADIFANDELKKEIKEQFSNLQEAEKLLKKKPYNKSIRTEYYNTMVEVQKVMIPLEDLVYKLGDTEEMCGVCPLLNESCDRIKYDPKRIKKVKKKLKELDADYQNFKRKVNIQDQRKEAHQTLKDGHKWLSELKKRKKPAKTLKTKLKGLKRRYKALCVECDKDKDDLTGKIKKIGVKIKNTKKGLDDCNQKLGQYKSRINQIKKAKGKASKLNKSINKLEVEVEQLKYLAFMFGKNGIPSQEIENAFGEIESDINFLLGKITSFEVGFNADKELGSWESECVGCGWTYPKSTRKKECNKCGEPRARKRKDELHLTIVEHGYESDFEMDSGGGHTFISLAVRIALTMLKKRQTNSQLDVVFLDEIDSALDDDAREQIMKLVWLLVKSLGFQQVFWVSHNKRIKESVPHTLKVKRFEKEAKAKWV